MKVKFGLQEWTTNILVCYTPNFTSMGATFRLAANTLKSPRRVPGNFKYWRFPARNTAGE